MISGHQNAEEFARAHQVSPLGYSSRPHDIAEAACYLAQAAAITGTTLIVDGGQHLIPLQHDVAFVTKTTASATTPTPTKTNP
jgi:NAD(P)-dependent dehydrogenase (short-subunit alcohol dehydrogenase family)